MEQFDPELFVAVDETELLDVIDYKPDRTFEHDDVLDGADRRGLPAGYLLPPPAFFNHEHAATEENLSTLLKYDFETVLVFHSNHILDALKKKLLLPEFRGSLQTDTVGRE